ncbi:hypothetical protein E3N88_41026 [Mikania micrantha]|uniref:DUF4219 domain-containing protein n=1 Tax=Mikania micrantha TaxID=192012 RepID=A0A5N6LPE2_9ASTR|nr:hypothetical protein E3N88_41026 [Mikania micrantha]
MAKVTESNFGNGKQPPKLQSTEDFENWKLKMKAFLKFTDYTLWDSICNGPRSNEIKSSSGSLESRKEDNQAEVGGKVCEKIGKLEGSGLSHIKEKKLEEHVALFESKYFEQTPKKVENKVQMIEIKENEEAKKGVTALITESKRGGEWNLEIEQATEELNHAFMAQNGSTEANNQDLKILVHNKDMFIKNVSEKLEKAQSDLLKAQLTIDKWNLASIKLDKCLSQQRSVKSKSGLDFTEICPPDNYAEMPRFHPANDLANFFVKTENVLTGLQVKDKTIEVEDGCEEKHLSSVYFNKNCNKETTHVCIDESLDDCSVSVKNCGENVSSQDFFSKIVNVAKAFVPLKFVKEGELSKPQDFLQKTMYSQFYNDVEVNEKGEPNFEEEDISHEFPTKGDEFDLEHTIRTTEPLESDFWKFTSKVFETTNNQIVGHLAYTCAHSVQNRMMLERQKQQRAGRNVIKKCNLVNNSMVKYGAGFEKAHGFVTRIRVMSDDVNSQEIMRMEETHFVVLGLKAPMVIQLEEDVFGAESHEDLEVEIENAGRLDMVVDLTNEVVKSRACNLKYECKKWKSLNVQGQSSSGQRKIFKDLETKLMKDDSQEKDLKR